MKTSNNVAIHFIAQQSATRLALNAFFELPLSLFGVSGLLAATVIPPPPVGSYIYGVFWLVVGFFVFLALLRNLLLRRVFATISQSSFLSLVYFGRKFTYFLVILAAASFVTGVAIANAPLGDFGLGITFIFLSIYIVFSGPLTNEGETRILFGLLKANLENFESRQQYLKTVSEKVEKQLKLGNIRVPHNDFVYYFNMELMKGTDVKNDLENIENWVMDKKTPCLDAIKKIYPEDKFEPCTKGALSERLLENPTSLLKYTFFSIVAIVLIVLHPEFVKDALGLLSKLLGI